MDVVSDISRRLAGVPDPVALLTGLFAHAPVGFQIYGADGHSLVVNEAFRDMFGSEPPPEYSIFDDEVAAERGVLELIHRAFAGETIHTPPIWYDPREVKHVEVLVGRRVAMETTFFPLISAAGEVTHVAIAFKDVTAEMLRRDEARRSDSLRRIGATFARELDYDRLVHLVTEEATHLIGVSCGAYVYQQDAQGGSDFALYAEPDTDKHPRFGLSTARVIELFAPTFRGEGSVRLDDVRGDPRFALRPFGEAAAVSYLAVPVVTRGGQVLGGLLFGDAEPARFTDEHAKLLEGLADQAAVAMENARLYGKLRRSEERARRADRRKDEFLAMLGHELRNPLAPIKTSLELLKRRRGFTASREYEIIERQVGHLIGLVDDLLDVSRITRGKIQLRRETVEMSAIVSNAIEMVSPLLEKRGHELEVERPKEPLLVEGDPGRMSQVVANLLHNAAKYTEPGGKVTIAVTGDDDEVSVTVRDTGIGLSPELVPVLFDMFVQANRSIERAPGGLGLGLTLVKRIVELHGGRVSARSEGPGKGSEFEVIMPRALPREAEQSAERTRPAVPSAGEGQLVLVVDDNEDAADLLASAMRAAGYEVEVAYDGPSALDLATRLEPDVVLLDLGLPVMDGYEVAQKLRERSLQDIRLIAITGYGQDSDRARTRALGFDRHFVKPVDLATLLESLRDARGGD
jgi:signal transduction histidine kinase/CheY-like chemotaxis protein